MNAAAYLYLISIITNLNVFFIITAVLSGALIFLGGVTWIESYSDKDDIVRGKKYMKIGIICGLISIFITVFFPSERTMYLMIGANYLEKSGIPTKVEQVINKKLDYYLTEEIKDKKK